MTDIEGSTKAWNSSPQAAKVALARHDRIIQEQVEANQGQIVESGREGDSFLAVFTQATDAIACALGAQWALQREQWPADLDVRVRMAVHTGEAELRSGHYVGAPLYRCAGLMAAAHGGQVLLSKATEELVAESLPNNASLRDLGEHHLRDISRPEHIYQLVHQELSAEFPPLRLVESKPAALPKPLTSFIGRNSDLSGLENLIHDSRLVTITGPGGIGKSRLAVELVQDMPGQWPDGVWSVDLALAEDSVDVAAEVAEALNLRAAGNATNAVTSFLARKRALVVLDSCEHVVTSCAAFCQAALRHCPQLTVLATSREGIGLAGEVLWPLSPLNSAESLRLFKDRGRQVRPGFDITDSNRTVVSEICTRLDGIPLAMELAASRVGAMSESEILRQLSERMSLLSGRGSTDPRHQTMSATIDWSYRLLTEDEAALFRRLSVFRGFTVGMAEAICADSQVSDVALTLAGLVQKSMVVHEMHLDNRGRYRLLDLMTSYANARLLAANEYDSTHKRHYDYLLNAVRSIEQRSRGNEPGVDDEQWKQRELDNMWLAVQWAGGHEKDLGLGLATSAAFVQAADLTRVRQLLTDLLDRSPSQGPDRMKGIAALSAIAFRQGDAPEQLRTGEKLKAMAEEQGDLKYLGIAIHGIGVAQLESARFEEAETAFLEALRIADASSDRRLFELTNNDLGCLALCQGRYKEARRILQDCVDRLKSSGVGVGEQLGATIESLASAELGCGEVERAESAWKESLAINRSVGDKFQMIGSLGGLARAATARGDHARAVRLAGAHRRLCEEYSCGEQSWWQQQLDESMSRSRATLGSEHAAQAWAQGRAMTMDLAVEYAMQDHLVPARGGVLSRRETEVAQLLGTGLTNRSIAEKLFLSERTIEGHVDRIKTKLGVRSRAEIGAWVQSQALVGPVEWTAPPLKPRES